MAPRREHRVLVASDGSPSAEAAIAAVSRFPWPRRTAVRAVVATFSNWIPADMPDLRSAIESDYREVAARTRRTLRKRWPDADVVVKDGRATDSILAEASHFEAGTVVVGWRGHGAFRRLLAGSVSRAVAERARCPVMVVRRAPRAVRRLVIGFDGCPNASRAAAFVGSLQPGAKGRAFLVHVLRPLHVPASVARLPASVRASIRHEAVTRQRQREEEARRGLAAAAAVLERAGWKVITEVRAGAPLDMLLKAVRKHRADMLVLGARATAGIERAILGSVASGALNHSPVPVLLVR